MSSQASFTQVPSTTVGNPQAANYILGLSGSVYQATPVAVADQQAQGFAIDEFGNQKVIGTSAVNAAQSGNPVAIGGRYDATLPTLDDGDQAIVQHDSRGRQIVTDDQLLAAIAAEDFATETTLAAILADTASLDAKDFATQTTLAALLTAFNNEDFASQTTLAAILADTTSLDGKDFATQTTLAALLTAFNNEDFASETTLAAILADTAIVSAWDTNAGAVGANTQRVHLSNESLAALENITATIDTGDIVTTFYNDAATNAVPGNATLPLTCVASLPADVSRVQVFDTMGFFLEIMTGLGGSEVRKFLIGPGSNETIEVDLAAGERISVRRLDDPAQIDVGGLALNFIS